MDEWLARLIRRFGRPADDEGAHSHTVMRMLDQRLDAVERRQREIAARLELLERQADPRGRRNE